MKNEHSSSGYAEDLIRGIVQVGCAELHVKTLIEKVKAEMENGLIDVSNTEVLVTHQEKYKDYIEELKNLAQIRRGSMLRLYELFEGDKDAWCLVKHLGVGAMCIFEAWEGSEDDMALYELAMDANKAFIRALSRFMGMELTECAACFSDMLKAEKGDK